MNALPAALPVTPLSEPKLKVINLFGGPGAGKSTTSAAVFNLMKRQRYDVELVTEVAKSMTYEHANARLSNQLLVLAKQEHQLRRLIGQVEYAIVDSPFPLGLIYCKPEHRDRYEPLIDALWDDYDNYSFRLQRTRKPFQAFGRNQTEDEAKGLDAAIMELAVDFDAGEFPIIDTDAIDVEYQILQHVLNASGLKAKDDEAYTWTGIAGDGV